MLEARLAVGILFLLNKSQIQIVQTRGLGYAVIAVELQSFEVEKYIMYWHWPNYPKGILNENTGSKKVNMG